MIRSVLLTSIALAIFSSTLFSQSVTELRGQHSKNVAAAVDSMVKVERDYAYQLLDAGNSYFHRSSWFLRSRSDSLMHALRDSLDSERRNSVRLYGLDLEQSIHALGSPIADQLNTILGAYERGLRALVPSRGTCPVCVTQDDFDRALAAFQQLADSIAAFYGDSMSTVVNDWETSVDGAGEDFASSVDDTLTSLKDDYAAYVKDHATRLDVELSSETHTSSRGRDNGLNQASYGPTLTYHHKTGIFASGGAGWASASGSSPDIATLGAGYEFTASATVEGNIEYTHFWYSSGSTRPGAVTNQEVSGMVVVSTTPLTFTGQVIDDYTVNGGSEVSVNLTLAKDIELSDHLWGGEFKISPSAEFTWGEQNEVLRQKRVLRAKKKNIVRITGTPDNTFGIMDYEFSIPLTLAVGNWTIGPTVAYILPVNVLNSGTVLVKDPSSESGFLAAGINVSLTVY